MIDTLRRPLIAPENPGFEGRAFGGTHYRVVVPSEDSDGGYGIMMMQVDPGFSPPLHIHQREDEIFHLVEGRLRVVCGNDTVDVVAGSTVVLPRGVPHSFVVTSATAARSIVTVVPGGFERFFAAVSRYDFERERDEVVRVSTDFGITYVGPPLSL